MKIKSIEFKNHKVLKDIKLDLSTSGNINDISLLIGENGCGKTIILEEIFKILSGGIILWGDDVYRKITVSFDEAEKVALSLPSQIVSFEYEIIGDNNWERVKIFDDNDADISVSIKSKLIHGDFNNYFKCMYSTVEINFATQTIDSVKATSIENEEKPKSKSQPELAREIAQLLVDIKAQDASDSDKWMKEHQNTNADVPVVEGKLDRFKKAYKKMFEGKELYDIRADGGFQKIIFKNSDEEEFGIENLSSGEKQVVYRVGYLLRNLNSLSGGVILIDEPELSLHPRWQIKYIDFLKDIFNSSGTSNIQFIIATHSPYLLKNSLISVGVSIFSREGSDVTIEKPKENSWSIFKNGPTLGEINYYAFKMPTIEFHNELYGYIQEKTGKLHEADIESYFSSKLINIDRPWIRLNGGVAQFPYNVSSMTYIRNFIHHPENTFNADFMPNDLKSSIENMIIIMEQDHLFT